MSLRGVVSFFQAVPSSAWKALKSLVWTASLKSRRVSRASFLSSFSGGMALSFSAGAGFSFAAGAFGGARAWEEGETVLGAGEEETWDVVGRARTRYITAPMTTAPPTRRRA